MFLALASGNLFVPKTAIRLSKLLLGSNGCISGLDMDTAESMFAAGDRPCCTSAWSPFATPSKPPRDARSCKFLGSIKDASCVGMYANGFEGSLCGDRRSMSTFV